MHQDQCHEQVLTWLARMISKWALQRFCQQAKIPAVPCAEGAPVDEEWEWLEAEEARIQERKNRNRKMQRLKEEEGK